MAPNIVLGSRHADGGRRLDGRHPLWADGFGRRLIFGVMRVVNFAQGEFLMLGMYGAVFAAALIAPFGLVGVTLGAYIGVLLTGPVIFILARSSIAWCSHGPPASARRERRAKVTTRR
jgi:hypothetical protein